MENTNEPTEEAWSAPGGDIVDILPVQEQATPEEQLISLATAKGSPAELVFKQLLEDMLSQMEEYGAVVPAKGHLHLSALIPVGGNGVPELDKLRQYRICWSTIKMLAAGNMTVAQPTHAPVTEPQEGQGSPLAETRSDPEGSHG